MNTPFVRLAIALLLPVAVQAQSVTARAVVSTARPGWTSIYFRHFDAAVAAAGLRPLREMTLAPGNREVRIWTQTEIAVPKYMYRFVEAQGYVQGDLLLYWPTDEGEGGDSTAVSTDRLMRYALRGTCAEFTRSPDAGICHARFTQRPDWRAVLRTVESRGLWTIPDPSTLTPDQVVVLDGWTIAVELRDSSGYRTYLYNTPSAHPKWPSAAQVTSVAQALRGIDSLMTPPAIEKRYRGVVRAAYPGPFRQCGDTTQWEFRGALASLAKHAVPAVRAAADSLALEDTASHREYYVEVRGELAAPGLAKYWGSRFSQVLQPFELLAIRPLGTVDCPAR